MTPASADGSPDDTAERVPPALRGMADTLRRPPRTPRRWPSLVDRPAAAVDAALARARPASDGGAFTRILAERARAEAAVLDAHPDARPLRGVPLAVKDLLAVAGSPIGAGSALRDDADDEPEDAAIVARLRGLGAVVVGLTALHEFAFGVTGLNEHTGSPANPVDATRIPGGSSSGSAVAVAEGSAVLALGTDTGGSVRIPAALCGVVGFKPAYGEYPTEGAFPLAPSLDHVGLLARRIGPIRTAHGALGHDPGHVALPARIGVPADDLEADDDVADCVRAALDRLERAGSRLQPIEWPTAERSFATSTTIMFAEAAAVHRIDVTERPQRFSRGVRTRLEAGLALDAPTYVAARREQRALTDEVRRLLETVDVVAGPAVPMTAPPIAAARTSGVSARLVRNTRLLNVVGAPALALPVPGPGMPVGLQLVAATSARVLGHAAAIEQLLDPVVHRAPGASGA